MIQDNNPPAFTLTVDQFKANIQDWISEMIEGLPFKPVYLTSKDLASKLQISLPALRDYTVQGIIPHLKFGKSVRYVEQDVYKALKTMSPK